MNYVTTLINPWMMPSDEGSDNWNATYLVGHCAFFSFHFFSVVYIVLFEGFVFRRLARNRLLLIGMFAPIVHAASCATSINRYNIDDTYGPFARAGTILSFVAAIPLNVVFLYLIFPRNTTAIRCGWAVWIVSAVALAIVGELNWDVELGEKNFEYLRAYIGAYAIYQTVALAVGHQHLKRGRIGIDPSIISQAEILRLFKVLFLVDLGALIAAASRNQLFGLPATGALFAVMVIAMTFVGRMDFMMGGSVGDTEPASKSGTKDASESEDPSGADPDHDHNVEGKSQIGRRVSFSSQGYFSDDSFLGDIEAPEMTQLSSEETPEEMVKNLKSVVDNLTDQVSQLKEATEKANKSGPETLDLAPPVKEVTTKDSESESTAILDINMYDMTMNSEPKGEEHVLKPSLQKSTVEGKGRSGSKKSPTVKQAKKRKPRKAKHAPQRMRDSVDPPSQDQGTANESSVRLATLDPPDDSSAGSGYGTPEE